MIQPQSISTDRYGEEHKTRPDDGAIRERAHQIYESRLSSGRQGDEFSDWIEAEQELGEKWDANGD